MLHYSTLDGLKVAAQPLTRGSWSVPQSLTDGLSLKYIVYAQSIKRGNRKLQVTVTARESICRINIRHLYLFMKVNFQVRGVWQNAVPICLSLYRWGRAGLQQPHAHSHFPLMNGHRAENSGGVIADQHASVHPFHTGFEVPPHWVTSLRLGSLEQIRCL